MWVVTYPAAFSLKSNSSAYVGTYVAGERSSERNPVVFATLQQVADSCGHVDKLRLESPTYTPLAMLQIQNL